VIGAPHTRRLSSDEGHLPPGCMSWDKTGLALNSASTACSLSNLETSASTVAGSVSSDLYQARIFTYGLSAGTAVEDGLTDGGRCLDELLDPLASWAGSTARSSGCSWHASARASRCESGVCDSRQCPRGFAADLAAKPSESQRIIARYLKRFLADRTEVTASTGSF
jgi:hypothetical protein